MRYLLLLSAILLFLYGCSGLWTKDCGEDEECFSDAAINCVPAKMVKEDSDFRVEKIVHGVEAETCVISMKYLESDNELLDGKEMTCRVPRDALGKYSGYPGYMVMGTLNPNIYDVCEGTLVDAMTEIQESLYTSLSNP